MLELGGVIRSIRKRKRLTQVQLADLLATRQNTVSQYEAGKITPSRDVLLLLLRLAEGDERQAILDALGVPQEFHTGWSDAGLRRALDTFEAYVASSPAERKLKRRKSELLAEFARASSAILARYETIEPALVDILELWLRHGRDRRKRQYFEYVALYLKAQMEAPENGRSMEEKSQ